MSWLELFGKKVKAKDVVNESGVNFDDIPKWKYVGYVANGYKTIDVDNSKWNECLIIVGVNSTDDNNRRALVSCVITSDVFARQSAGYSLMSEGRHQAYYSSTYRGGLDFISESQVRIYASSSALTRLYYR